MDFTPEPGIEFTEDPPALAIARQQATRRSTWVSVAVNIILSVGQVAAGVVSGSQGLVADGIHSLSDLLADFVVLFASRHSHKDPDEDHPYGHYRYENAASLVLGILLLIVAFAMLWSALTRLQSAQPMPAVAPVALWVALAALAAKEVLFRYLIRIAERVRSTLLAANAWHARSDAASSLVVMIGVAGNLAGFHLLDPIAAVIVAFIVGRMGWTFGWDALHDLMDRAASVEEIAAIRQTLLEAPGVLGLHDLRTRRTGDLIAVDVHLEVDADMTVAEGHDIASTARQAVLDRYRVLDVMTHVDPVKIRGRGV